MDETYANGDGTDSWCKTNKLVPQALYKNQLYPTPACGKDSCLIPWMTPTPYIVETTDVYCTLFGPSSLGNHFACV